MEAAGEAEVEEGVAEDTAAEVEAVAHRAAVGDLVEAEVEGEEVGVEEVVDVGWEKEGGELLVHSLCTP